MSPKISPDTTVATLFQQEPRLAPFFVENGLHCVGCMMDMFCTLAQVEAFYELPNFVERVQAALQALASSAPLPPTNHSATWETHDDAP
ncbi:DUF1858 domain-containing protein [Ardenticatena maritima]|uniref:DUF1858 domain-containing protein n=1 Tax=Ardenticatena maritima TaxID=872965 RepID=A0A0P6Y512_9CHLR|nr:DUF1858 domain-containing protein [Ardenticatena maritima]KPL86965.1 hypothetical protein SE16_12925 [Ardenticatena maritima]